jgi:putative restriction endonuclease
MGVLLTDLPDWHVEVLAWFQKNEGRFFDKRPVHEGLRSVVTPPMYLGILRPAISRYAISVYQSWKGKYPDQPPIEWGDGKWTYVYHQEGPSTEDPLKRGTNRGLVECRHDGVPVGVMLPASQNGVRGYRVLGLASVDDHRNGCFVLTGPVSIGDEQSAAGQTRRVQLIDFPVEPFNPDAEADDRQKVTAEVVRRQGQPQFRSLLLRAYCGQCCISRFDAEPALEAAHIIRYKGAHSNHPENGLLLRADLHDLFDLGLIAVRPDRMRVVCASELMGTRYEDLADAPMALPGDPALRPNERALQKHCEMVGLAS